MKSKQVSTISRRKKPHASNHNCVISLRDIPSRCEWDIGYLSRYGWHFHLLSAKAYLFEHFPSPQGVDVKLVLDCPDFLLHSASIATLPGLTLDRGG